MRLFVALPLPEPARDAMDGLQMRFSAGRPTPFDNLHLTLAFLGEQPDATAEAVHDALETLRAPAPMLQFSGGAVYGGKHGQAVAIGAEGGAGLLTLHDRVLSRLRSAGVTLDRRRFRPHVTLGRLKGRTDAAPLLNSLTGVALGPYLCPAFALLVSHLHRDGAVHEELARYPLSPT